jgi:electron transport complex protein RnfB
MHTVIAGQCTGCELCIPPCPVDCIRMMETGHHPNREERMSAAERARSRFLARHERLARERAEQSAHRTVAHDTSGERKRLVVKRAIERARARLRERAARKDDG